MRLWLFAAVYLGVARRVLSIRRQAVRNHGARDADADRGRRGGRGAPRQAAVSDPALSACARRLPGRRPAPGVHSRAGHESRPVLGGPQNLADGESRRTGARHVILAFSLSPTTSSSSGSGNAKELGVEVSVVPRMFEPINDRATLDHVGGLPLISCSRPTRAGGSSRSSTRSTACSRRRAGRAARPCCSRSQLAVRLNSPGPVLFRQRRVGRDGRVFDVSSSARCASRAAAQARFKPLDGMRARRDRGRGPPDARRPLAAQHLARRAAAAAQRAARRDEHRRPAPGAPRVRASCSRPRSTATTIATASSRASPAGRRSTACAARPRSPTASSGTTTTSATGRSASTCKIMVLTLAEVLHFRG